MICGKIKLGQIIVTTAQTLIDQTAGVVTHHDGIANLCKHPCRQPLRENEIMAKGLAAEILQFVPAVYTLLAFLPSEYWQGGTVMSTELTPYHTPA